MNETELSTELEPIAKRAKSIEINSQDDLASATILLSQLNKYNDRITEEKERITKPLNEALKAERSRWKPIENLYTNAIEAIRTKMTVYQTNLVNIQNKAKMKVADKLAQGKIKVETAISKIESLQPIEKEVATSEGLVQFRETKTLKITDKSLIPFIYYSLDDKKLLDDLKEGIIVPGCEIEILQVPVNYR